MNSDVSYQWCPGKTKCLNSGVCVSSDVSEQWRAGKSVCLNNGTCVCEREKSDVSEQWCAGSTACLDSGVFSIVVYPGQQPKSTAEI